MIASWWRTFPGALAAAWATAAAPMLLTFASEAVPSAYLVRPLLASMVVGVGVGTVAAFAGRMAWFAAVALTVLITVPALWPVLLIALGLETAIQFFQHIRHRPLPRVGAFTRTVMVALLFLGALRAGPVIWREVTDSLQTGTMAGADPPVYLILLDGYPRLDTLAELGYDNSAFIRQLGERGFDHYPNATSAHGFTDHSLAAMLAGDPIVLPTTKDAEDPIALRQSRRLSLVWPVEFTVLDPPLGHITTRGGQHLNAGGLTDLEIEFLRRSLLPVIASDWTSGIVADSLRAHLSGTLDVVTQQGMTNVFAHLVSPHPPFLYAEDLPGCWPASCDAFMNWADGLGLTLEEWASKMARQIDGLNADLLTAIDEIIAADRGAVIVLFSDHGGRYRSPDVHDEWQRSFLAARTPEHPMLFTEEPHPHAVLRLTMDAYRVQGFATP